jgi:hypothetical protein
MLDLTIPRADHTPIDNYFLDFIVQHLTEAEVRVYLQLVYERQWGGSDTISISYSALAQRTGLNAASVKRGVWMLYARRLLDKEIVADATGHREGNRYTLLPLPESPVQE